MTSFYNNQLRIGVIGVGPVGSTLTAHLIDAGAYVVPCDIDRIKVDKIRENGIRLTGSIQKEVKIPDACYSASELAKYDLDLVVISVKTPYLNQVLTQLLEVVSERTFVMCAQNGLDNELEVAKVFGKDRTLRMVINYAGKMVDPITVLVTFFNPPNYVASLGSAGNPVAETFTKLLNSVDLKTVIPDDIRIYIWEKVILNASLAPVCAITRHTMKDVMDSTQGLNLVEAILDESICVAVAEGFDFRPNFRSHCIRYLKSGGHHRSSMLVDLNNNLPTEIDCLNGRIVEYGYKHSIPTPMNQAIAVLIHLLEQSPEGNKRSRLKYEK